MNQIHATARFPSIPPDSLAEFKRFAAQALEIANGEAGTLQYAWFFDDDEMVCVVQETYEDSAALLAHAANMADTFDQLLAAAGGSCTVEMFGNPSTELIEAISGRDLSIYSYFQGK